MSKSTVLSPVLAWCDLREEDDVSHIKVGESVTKVFYSQFSIAVPPNKAKNGPDSRKIICQELKDRKTERLRRRLARK